jgi:hypothetical protein
MNESIGWLWGQLDEFLGRQAFVPPRKSHRHRPEGATIAPFVTIGAGSGQHFLDRRTPQTIGAFQSAVAKPQAGEQGSDREPSSTWLRSARQGRK